MRLRTGWAPHPPLDPRGWRGNILWLQRGEAGLTVTLRTATGSSSAPGSPCADVRELQTLRSASRSQRQEVKVPRQVSGCPNIYFKSACWSSIYREILKAAGYFSAISNQSLFCFSSWLEDFFTIDLNEEVQRWEETTRGFTWRKRKGNRHHDGIKDPTNPNGGDHPPPGKKRRKLLQQLQGQFTHRDQSTVRFSFIFHSGEWVTNWCWHGRGDRVHLPQGWSWGTLTHISYPESRKANWIKWGQLWVVPFQILSNLKQFRAKFSSLVFLFKQQSAYIQSVNSLEIIRVLHCFSLPLLFCKICDTVLEFNPFWCHKGHKYHYQCYVSDE